VPASQQVAIRVSRAVAIWQSAESWCGVGGHQPGVFRGAPGIGLAGAVGGGEHRFTQQCVAGLGQAVLRAG
jgi:hypothetical protein